MNCRSCQNVMADDALFCASCGMSAARHASDAVTQRYGEETRTAAPRLTDDRHAQDPRIGLTLDSRYKLIERLGEGGMGSVFRAQRLHIGDEVAVKLLHRDLVQSTFALERFRREARAAAMIRHPNVVSIHDFSDGSGAGEAYIVMELVQGVSLGNLLRREGRMPPQRAIKLMLEICSGVGVAHSKKLLHRDLKPDNVIVVPPTHAGGEERAKVVDFGLAKASDLATSAALTQTGTVVGTLYYMSPEQFRCEELDPRADVYSLGAMLYEMLSGVPPFRADHLAGLISKHLHEPPPHLPESLGIPYALESICMRALAKDRNQRPADAFAFGQELQQTQAPIIFQPSPATTAPKLSPLKWLLAAGLVLAGLVISIAVAMFIGFGIDWNPPFNSREVNQQEATTSTADLRGTWSGTYGPMGSATKLTIEKHDGRNLDGVLEQGTIRVAFKGTYDPQTRALTMTQTDVAGTGDWSLGEDTGKLSDDGRKISGTGKDALGGALGISYEWSFTKN